MVRPAACWPPPRRRPVRHRDRAVLERFYATSVRLGELHGMDLGDVDRLDCTVIDRGKGNRERQVLYDAPASDALHRYLLGAPLSPARSSAPFG